MESLPAIVRARLLAPRKHLNPEEALAVLNICVSIGAEETRRFWKMHLYKLSRWLHDDNLLLSDRARGLREVIETLDSLFDGAAHLSEHLDSVLLGVSQAPRTDGDGDPIELGHIQVSLDSSCISGSTSICFQMKSADHLTTR